MCKLHELSTVQFVCTEYNERLYEALPLLPTCSHNIQRYKYTYRILCLCVSPYSKPDTQLYVDPHVQLQDNPAYVTAGTTTEEGVNTEVDYKTYQ